MALSWYGEKIVKNDSNEDVLARYIKTNIDMVRIEDIGTSTVKTSLKYGINSTFFNTSTLDMIGIAVQDGAYVNNGTKNGNETNVYPRGTLYRLTDGTVGAKKAKYATEIASPLSNIKWAIGGVSLHLDKTFASATAFYDAIQDERGSLEVTNRLTRTAIGVDGSNQVYLITFFKPGEDDVRDYGLSLYEEHKILKNDFNLTKAVNLDGGGSTAIAFKRNATSSREVYFVVERKVSTMVTVPGTSFGNV